MTVDEIKAAVAAGKTVHWATRAYTVVRDDRGGWLIVCKSNGHCIGLTWSDGRTLNGAPADFFIGVAPLKDESTITPYDLGRAYALKTNWHARVAFGDSGLPESARAAFYEGFISANPHPEFSQE